MSHAAAPVRGQPLDTDLKLLVQSTHVSFEIRPFGKFSVFQFFDRSVCSFVAVVIVVAVVVVVVVDIQKCKPKIQTNSLNLKLHND